jgi:hypothetical protein
MMRERSPELSRSGVRQLVDEAMHRTLDPPPYGGPLSRAVTRAPDAWLVSAILAGHLPAFEDLDIAARAVNSHPGVPLAGSVSRPVSKRPTRRGAGEAARPPDLPTSRHRTLRQRDSARA